MGTVCFYHSVDADGEGSGAIVKLAHPETVMYGLDYGHKIPHDLVKDGDTLYIVDFSLPVEDMKALDARCTLVLMDHHKTALDAAAEEKFVGLQSLGSSGIELTWEYFHSEHSPMRVSLIPIPRAVRLIGAHDNWNHTDPETWPFHYGLMSCNTDPRNSPFWHNLFTDRFGLVDQIIESGKPIQVSVDSSNKKYAEVAAFRTILPNGLRAIAINKGLTGSAIADSVFDPDMDDITLVFYWAKTFWRFSIYTDKIGLPSLGDFAKTQGVNGGGHQKAAGFQLQTLPDWLFSSNKKV